MNKIEFSKGNVTFISGQEAFSEILKGLLPGENLYISTYNIFIDEEKRNLIQQNSKYSKDVKLLFNAYSIKPEENLNIIEYVKTEEGKKIIKTIRYLKDRCPQIQIFINKKNHTKVYSNGKRMYIGSANASSKDSLETGVMIEDVAAIQNVEQTVFYDYILDSYPVYTDWLSVYTTFLGGILHQSKELIDLIEKYYFEHDFQTRLKYGDKIVEYTALKQQLLQFKTQFTFLIKDLRVEAANNPNNSVYNDIIIFVDWAEQMINTLTEEKNIVGSKTIDFINFYNQQVNNNYPNVEQYWYTLLMFGWEKCGYQNFAEEMYIYNLLKVFYTAMFNIKVNYYHLRNFQPRIGLYKVKDLLKNPSHFNSDFHELL
jgi:hypothetical protein